MANNKKNYLIIDLIIAIALAVVLAITMPFSAEIELALGLSYYVDANGERVDPSVARAEDSGAELVVHFVNVRQGDCCIIELPDGKMMIIDGADSKSQHRELVLGYIEKNFPELEYFDYAILTHADADHCGSLDDVLNMYPAYTVYRPNVLCKRDDYTDPAADSLLDCYGTATTAAYRDFLRAAYAPQKEIDFMPEVIVTDATDDSQTITGGAGDEKYSLTFYSPLYAQDKKYTNANDYSSIMLFEYRGFSFVLTGDAEAQNEKEFVAKVEAAKTDGVTDKFDRFTDTFNADVIKAGHHGSRSSTSQGLLDIMTTPDGAKNAYYVFSCDATDGNTYGHPHVEVLDRIAAMGVPQTQILRTDEIGDITFAVRADTDGAYKLFYGDAATEKPDEPTEPDEPCETPEYTLVYVKIGNFELRWKFVAWIGYAAVVVVLLLHIAGVNVFGSRRRRGR